MYIGLIVGLEIRGLHRHDRVRHRMRFVEAVAGEVTICSRSVRHRLGHAATRRAVHELGALGKVHGLLLLLPPSPCATDPPGRGVSPPDRSRSHLLLRDRTAPQVCRIGSRPGCSCSIFLRPCLRSMKSVTMPLLSGPPNKALIAAMSSKLSGWILRNRSRNAGRTRASTPRSCGCWWSPRAWRCSTGPIAAAPLARPPHPEADHRGRRTAPRRSGARRHRGARARRVGRSGSRVTR